MTMTGINLFSIFLTIFLIRATGSMAAKQPILKAKTTSFTDVKLTAKEVHDKLSQLHSVIDGLKAKVKLIGEGTSEDGARQRAGRIQEKFEKLTQVITKLSTQNLKLYGENKALRMSNEALVDKISALELRLKRKAEKETNVGVESWLRQTATELKSFLEENGMEHFTSPRFSPIVAGIVSNGVVLLPLAMASLFLLHFVKQLTVLRLVMAFNLFDVGMAIATIFSTLLLLGDPLEGLRHISEVNFVFIQILLAAIFWLTMVFLGVAMVQNWRNRAWKVCLVEMGLKVTIAVEYTRKVWVPVMDRDDVSIALPGLFYAFHSVAMLTCVGLTAWANRCAVSAHHRQTFRADDRESDQLMVIPFHERPHHTD